MAVRVCLGVIREITERNSSPMPLTLRPDMVSRKALAAVFLRESVAGLHRRLAPCRSRHTGHLSLERC